MSITVVARSAAALCVALVCAVAAIAQIPTVPSAPAFQVAEVRGLEDAPASAESGFESGHAGPRFAGTTRAVDVPFDPQVVIGTDGDAPQVVEAADVDGDGDQDVLAASNSDSEVFWYEGTYSEYAADYHRRKGVAVDQPHRIRYKKLVH